MHATYPTYLNKNAYELTDDYGNALFDVIRTFSQVCAEHQDV